MVSVTWAVDPADAGHLVSLCRAKTHRRALTWAFT
jgi:hypothetical protein